MREPAGNDAIEGLPLVERARTNRGFVSLAQGAQAGLTDAQMRRLLRLGEWQWVSRGVRRLRESRETGFETGRETGWSDRVRASLLVAGAGAVAAGETAAELHGIVGAPASAPLWIAVPLDRHPQHRPGIRLIRTRVDPAELLDIDSIPTTSVLRTLLDCARHGEQLPAVCLIESAVRLGLVTLVELGRAIREIHGQRGSVRAATALSRVDVRSESPLETKARLLLLDAGLPYPEPQQPVAPGDARRIDLAYLAPPGSAYAGLAIEIDGRAHHAREAAFHADPRRQTALEEANWLVRRFTDQHLGDAEYVVRTVLRALERINYPTE